MFDLMSIEQDKVKASLRQSMLNKIVHLQSHGYAIPPAIMSLVKSGRITGDEFTLAMLMSKMKENDDENGEGFTCGCGRYHQHAAAAKATMEHFQSELRAHANACGATFNAHHKQNGQVEVEVTLEVPTHHTHCGQDQQDVDTDEEEFEFHDSNCMHNRSQKITFEEAEKWLQAKIVEAEQKLLQAHATDEKNGHSGYGQAASRKELLAKMRARRMNAQTG